MKKSWPAARGLRGADGRLRRAQGLAEFVILVSAIAAAIFLLRRIRSRTKLIYVGAFAGLVVMLTTIGVGTLTGRAIGVTSLAMSWTSGEAGQIYRESFLLSLLVGAAWFGVCSLLAGVLMTGLLPFVERLFDVQTDISLLELGDVPHPLLQELVRRAGHLQPLDQRRVASPRRPPSRSAPTACSSASARYFHDIGKMLKPHYFVENQGPDGTTATSQLSPAMSTLVIIGHVKDGARPRPAASPAAADHRLHRAAPRHDARRVLLSPRSAALARSDPGRRAELDEIDLPLSRPQAADQGSRRADAGRRRRKRQPRPRRSHARRASKAWSTTWP